MEVPSPPPSCRRRGASCPSRRPRRPSGREVWTRGAAARTARAAAREELRRRGATYPLHRVRRRRRRWTGGAEGARPRTPDLSVGADARRPQSATAEEAHLRSRRGAAELPNHQSLCEEEVHLQNHPDGAAGPNRRSGCAHRIRRPFWEHHHHQSRHRGARRRSRRGARRRHRIRRAGGRRRHRNRGAAEARRRAGRRRGASPTGRPGRRAVRHRAAQRDKIALCTSSPARCCSFETARSRLYRRRFLQPNSHFAAFFKIYKIFTILRRSNLNILQNFKLSKMLTNFWKI